MILISSQEKLPICSLFCSVTLVETPLANAQERVSLEHLIMHVTSSRVYLYLFMLSGENQAWLQGAEVGF